MSTRRNAEVIISRVFIQISSVGVLLAFLITFPGLSWSKDDKEEYKEQVYLTKKQALQIAFPDADQIDREKKWLTDAQREAIGKICLQKIKDSRITFYVGKKAGKPIGYAILDYVIGKSLPINFMVVLNTDGTVRNVEIMVYREPHGWEVRYKGFLSQFFGRNAESDFKDVNSITGATISVRSITRGVYKAVAAFKVLYLQSTDSKS